MRGWRIMAKYRNTKVEVDGILFDSIKEGKRYKELKLMERANVIHTIECQKVFKIEVNGMHICKYIADFAYIENNSLVVEDVKSYVTAKLPVYRLKKKLLQATHGITVQEV